MTRKPLQLLIALACSTPLNAAALGVGQIQVRSALNQALDADIPLLLDNPTEAAGVNVRLAPAAAFAQKGIDRPVFLNDLVFAVQTSPDGRGYIKVTSKRPIREPLLNFLVQIDWPKGRIVREFAALLDPPVMLAGRREPVFPTAPVRAAPSSPALTAPPAAPLIGHRGAATYGPVPYGATLWSIATQVRPDPSISPQRMMQALLAANPRAFWKHNVNGLRAGATLRIPSAQEIDPARFPEELSRQLAARQPVPVAPTVAQATPAASQRQAGLPDAAAAGERVAEPADKPQVKLVRPEAAGATQRPEQEPRRPAAPAAGSLIKLKGAHPELRLAGLDELRQRIGANPNLGAGAATKPGAATPLNPPAPPVSLGSSSPAPPTAAPLSRGEPPSLAETQAPPVTGGPPQSQPRLQDALPAGLAPPLLAPPPGNENLPATAGLPVEQPFTLPKPESAPPRSPATVPTPPAVTPPAPITQPTAPAPAFTGDAEPGGLSLSDWLTPVRLILLGGLLLLLASGFMLWLRRRSEQGVGEDVLAIEGVAPTPQPMERLEPPSRITALETEPATRTRIRTAPESLERADLLLAVGNYADAEKVVREALADEPDHASLLAKLLDVQFAARDAKAFLQTARTLHARLGNAADPLWLHAADMGRQLCPNEALFNKADELFTPTKTMAHVEAGAAPLRPAAGSRAETPVAAEPTLFIDLDRDDVPTTKPGRAASEHGDWQLSEIDQPTAKTAAAASNESAAELAPEDRSQPLDELDWQFPELEPATLPTQAPPPAEEPTVAPDGQEPDMDSLFTREITGSQLTGPEAENTIPFPTTRRTNPRESRDALAEPMAALEFDLDDTVELKLTEQPMTGIDYVETKLDLAVAYLDLGDPVGARNLLQEVLQEGNDSQQQKAQSLLAKLSV